MPQKYVDLINHLPFFLATTIKNGANVNFQRIIEAVLIAALTAGVTVYAGQAVLETRAKYTESRLTEVLQEVRALRNDVTAAKIEMGDRWTATDDLRWQQGHERDLSKRFGDVHDRINGLAK